MMSETEFNRLVVQIMDLGFNEETACDYAQRIGDTPENDEAGLVIVRNDAGEVIARLNLDD